MSSVDPLTIQSNSNSIGSHNLLLDLMRGISALVVLLGHARVEFIGSLLAAVGLSSAEAAFAGGLDLETITTPGHVAVIVFFVLSGYFVGGGAIKKIMAGKWSTTEYAIQRLTRLWTVLLPALLLTMFWDRLGTGIFGFTGLYGAPQGQYMIGPLLNEQMDLRHFFANLFFLNGIVIKEGSGFGTNSPLWSLAYEFWFYVAGPILFLAIHATVARGRWPLVSGLSLVLICIGWFVGPTISGYFLIWLLGSVLVLIPALNFKRPGLYTAMVFFVFIVFCIVVLKLKPHRFLSDGIEAILVAGLIICIQQMGQLKVSSVVRRAITGLSDMSYTLYLVHAPILAFLATLLLPAAWAPWPLSLMGLLKYVALCAAVIAYSWGVYFVFERNTYRVRGAVTKIVQRS